MFNIAEITNANRHRKEEKMRSIPLEELFEDSLDEDKPMPYFSVVPEQAKRHEGYQALSPNEQGQFLRLCVEIAGPGKHGRCPNMEPLIAKWLNLSVDEWRELKAVFLKKGLLIVSPDELYLVQPGLREQCLQYSKKGQKRKGDGGEMTLDKRR